MAKGFKLNFALFWIFGSFFVFFNFTGARRNGSVSQKLSPPPHLQNKLHKMGNRFNRALDLLKPSEALCFCRYELTQSVVSSNCNRASRKSACAPNALK